MKIALINESSQYEKNDLIYTALKKEADKAGHEVYNYGMYVDNNPNRIGYVQVGLLASILLTTKAVDFVVTGCGTGQGAGISCNAYPNVVCGFIKSDLDAFLFSQVNAGNAISLAFAQDFGWGADVNLEYIFEKLFAQDFGGGFPKHLKEGQERSRGVMTDMKSKIHPELIDILHNLDDQFILDVTNYPQFKEYFFEFAEEGEVKEYIKELLENN